MAGKRYILSRDIDTFSKQTFHRFLLDQTFVDVTLVCDDGTQIKAHKVILSAGSNFFKTMFQENPHQHPLVYLYGIARGDLEAALEFLYLGKTNVLESDLDKFLEISEKLKFVGMTNPEEHRKYRTPDLVKRSDKIVSDKELIEETTRLGISSDKNPIDKKIHEVSLSKMHEYAVENSRNPITTTYHTGYTTAPVFTRIVDTKDEVTQKESLNNLRKSFDRYDREKCSRLNVIRGPSVPRSFPSHLNENTGQRR